MEKAAPRLGVEIGGTFTDVVLEAAGRRFSTKVLTTYAAPEDALCRVCTRCAASPPGGAGYGPSSERSFDLVKRDLALGYISARTAERAYGLGQAEIEDVLTRAQRGEAF